MTAVPHHLPMRVNLKDLLESFGNDAFPQLDLKWDPFQNKIDRFLSEVDRFAGEARAEIGERAYEHSQALRDIDGKKVYVEKQITEEREQEGEMLATLEQERRAVQDINAHLHQLRTNLSKVREQSQQLESELNAMRKDVTSERAEKERQGKALSSMKSRDGEDLEALQDAIGWRVEGIGQDKLLMRFTLIDPSDPNREFAIVIDISKHDYTITKCSPHLPNLAELLRDLNADRDFTAFIKRVRKGFKALCPTSEPGSRLDKLSGVTRTPGRSREQSAKPVEEDLAGLDLDDKA